MFYQGDLRGGIAKAVSESKSLICFVYDDSAESLTWEREYFTDDEVTLLIEAKSICVRFETGSQEAGFLSSFCPIAQAPVVVVIKGGQVAAYVPPGVSKEDFRLRLRAGLEDVPPPAQSSSTSTTSETSTAPNRAPEVAGSSNEEQRPTPVTESAPPNNTRTEPPTTASTPTIIDHAITEPPTSDQEFARQRQDYIKRQKLREQSQNAERARILERIRSDREEFKRKDNSRLHGHTVENASTNVQESTDRKTTGPSRKKQVYRIQVRLLDGHTIRETFTGDQTIGKDVRQWIDSHAEGERGGSGSAPPYTLKQVLTPMPNRTLSLSDEEEGLASLDLGSSATLVMVPVQSFTNAYAGAGPGLISRGIWGGYGLVSSAVGTVYGGVSSFLGYGQQNQSSSSSDSGGGNRGQDNAGHSNSRPINAAATQPGTNIRTLADQRREGSDQQFYNGNQLNFQPQNDGDEDQT